MATEARAEAGGSTRAGGEDPPSARVQGNDPECGRTDDGLSPDDDRLSREPQLPVPCERMGTVNDVERIAREAKAEIRSKRDHPRPRVGDKVPRRAFRPVTGQQLSLSEVAEAMMEGWEG